MNVTVLSLESAAEIGKFKVIVLIGTEQYQFTMTREENLIDGTKIPLIKGDKNFGHIFRYNQEVAVNLYKLVSQFIHNQKIEFPAQIGYFSKREIERVSVK